MDDGSKRAGTTGRMVNPALTWEKRTRKVKKEKMRSQYATKSGDMSGRFTDDSLVQ